MDFKAKAAALAAKAAAAGVDQTKAQTGGGGDYEAPAAGPCRLRLVSYVEIGKHQEEYQGQKKVQNQVMLTFEISGPKHPAKVLEDGTKLPHRITVTENLSLNEKARFFKLFGILNYSGAFTHAVQAVGEAYKATLIHRKFKRKGDPADEASWTGLAVDIWNRKTSAWTVEPPRYEVVDPESGPTGEYAALKVDPAITPLKAFLWDFPEMEDWNNLFIDGQYPERKDKEGKVIAPAKSKNVIQAKILSAMNIKGSPLALLLASNGKTLDIPDVDTGDEAEEQAAEQAVASAKAAAPTGRAATDSLNGVV